MFEIHESEKPEFSFLLLKRLIGPVNGFRFSSITKFNRLYLFC
jgi:hypothetical protein